MKMQVSLGQPQPWVLPVTIVCLALGALIASLMSIAPAETPDPNMRPEELLRYYQKQNADIKEENRQLKAERNEAIDGIANETKSKKILLDELNNLRIRAGTTAVEGPGIVITVDDTNIIKSTTSVNDSARLTHDVDLMLLVNELRAADAEAIAMNDQRVGANSAVRCVGPTIQINHQAVSAPFVVRAVGKPDVLAGAVNLPYGVLDQLKALGIHVEVAKRDVVHVPAITTLPTLEVGKVVPDANGNKP